MPLKTDKTWLVLGTGFRAPVPARMRVGPLKITVDGVDRAHVRYLRLLGQTIILRRCSSRSHVHDGLFPPVSVDVGFQNLSSLADFPW